jgi:hypothetical protein
MTDELRHIILKLKDRIADSEGYEERLNEASWTHQIGILITRNEANLIVSELEKPLPTEEQIEQFALENILEDDSSRAFVEMKRWVETGDVSY